VKEKVEGGGSAQGLCPQLCVALAAESSNEKRKGKRIAAQNRTLLGLKKHEEAGRTFRGECGW
jgi:hypothetical protein